MMKNSNDERKKCADLVAPSESKETVVNAKFVTEIMKNLGEDIRGFKAISFEVSTLIGRPLFAEENMAVLEAIREGYIADAVRERVREDSCRGYSCDNFVICTAYSKNYEIGRVCEFVNRAYAERHGYTFISDCLAYDEMIDRVKPRTHCTWYKILMLNKLMADEEFLRSHRVRYLLWIDADAVVVNPDIRLEQVVELAGAQVNPCRNILLMERFIRYGVILTSLPFV